MRETTSTLAAAIAADTQTPAAKVTLYRTPHGDSYLGPAVCVWKNTDTASGTPWLGDRPLYPGVDPWSNWDLILAERGQLAAWWGTSRPYGLPETEPHVFRFEGYFYWPAGMTTMEVLLIGNGYPVSFGLGGVGTAPSAASAQISYNATKNTDQREGTTNLYLNTAGLYYPIFAEAVLLPGAIGKLVVLWRPEGTGTWRLMDAASVNCRAQAESSVELPGVVKIDTGEDKSRAGTVSIQIAPGTSSSYTYDASADAYGILRGGSRLKVELGYETSAGTELLEVGNYFVDDVDRDEGPGPDTLLTVTARDSLGKAADELATLLPDVVDYDVAGYSSDDVWLEPDQLLRYTAFDSWTLAKTVRALLYKAGLSSRQLHAVDAGGEDLIVEKGVRLDRSATYRLRLPQIEKLDTLNYSPEPGSRLLDFLLELVETYGYVFRLDGAGNVILKEKENGTAYAINSGGWTFSGLWSGGVAAIDSHAGAERSATGAATVSRSNPDGVLVRLFFRRKTSGAGTFSLTAGGTPVVSGVDLTHDRNWSWRDGIDPSTGTNPCVFEYRGIDTGTLQIDVTTGATFQGAELVTEDAEADAVELAGERETLKYRTSTASIRNDVIVAGAERGADTGEFVIARAVDVQSIGRPAAPSFLGRRRLFLYPDARIRRDDQASYIAFRNLQQFQTLQDAATWISPGRPELELDDPATVYDVKTATALPGTRFVDQISHSWTNASFLSTVRLNPYPPLESYRLPLDPISVTDSLTDFELSRTDGGSLDPSLHSGNSLSVSEWSSREDGVYSPNWAEEADAVHVRISLSVWRPGFLTLDVKDVGTHKIVARLVQDQFVDWGAYSFLWGGRWYTPDGDSYLFYPQDPEGTVAAWAEYQGQTDPVNGLTQGRSGWVYVEARFDPLDSTIAGEIVAAVNADDTSLNYVHVILGPKAGSVSGVIYSLQPIYNIATTPDFTPHGGRYDIHLDEWTPSLPRGFRVTTGFLHEDVSFKVRGWLDVYVYAFVSTDYADGGTYIYYAAEFDEESFASGRFLWNVDGTPVVVSGETDFLAPGSYQFLIDPVGMPLKVAEPVSGDWEIYYEDNAIGVPVAHQRTKRASLTVPKLQLSYRENLLGFLGGLFPGRIVGVGVHFGLNFHARNRAGEDLTGAGSYAYRLEATADAGNKHGVIPPYSVSGWAAGAFARLRTQKPYGTAEAHITLPSSYSTGNLHYD